MKFDLYYLIDVELQQLVLVSSTFVGFHKGSQLNPILFSASFTHLSKKFRNDRYLFQIHFPSVVDKCTFHETALLANECGAAEKKTKGQKARRWLHEKLLSIVTPTGFGSVRRWVDGHSSLCLGVWRNYTCYCLLRLFHELWGTCWIDSSVNNPMTLLLHYTMFLLLSANGLIIILCREYSYSITSHNFLK